MVAERLSLTAATTWPTLVLTFSAMTLRGLEQPSERLDDHAVRRDGDAVVGAPEQRRALGDVGQQGHLRVGSLIAGVGQVQLDRRGGRLAGPDEPEARAGRAALSGDQPAGTCLLDLQALGHGTSRLQPARRRGRRSC